MLAKAATTFWGTTMNFQIINGRRLRRLAVALAAVCLGSAGTAEARPAPAPDMVIPLEPYVDEHWAFHADINGHDQLMVFDTGGGITAVTPGAAAALGCRPWGQITGFRMRGDRLDLKRCDSVTFQVQGRRFFFPTVGIWDFSANLPKDAKPIAANVGLNIFAGRIVTLDIPNRKLILESPASFKARIAGAKAVPIHLLKEVEGYSTTLMLGLDTPKGRVWMGLDSGDDTPITIGRHIADALGLDPAKKGGQPVSLTLAGGVPLSGEAFVHDIVFDGNIGAPIISKWVVTMDLAQDRVWIAEAPGISQPTASARPR